MPTSASKRRVYSLAPFLLACSAAALLHFLYRKKLIGAFIFNAVTGLLLLVVALCLSPLTGIDIGINAFTVTVAAVLGPFGAPALLLLALFWEI